jgi:oxygen-independent coproporphyrinogen-3 oxidase
MAGIYLHIPFCKKLCNYCDFYHVISKDDNSAFIKALVREAELRKDYTGNEEITTIYFGGGTPSVLAVGELEEILTNLRKLFPVSSIPEVTIEINPDDITEQYMKDLKKTEINRISIGVQSWRDEDLKLLNRRHSGFQAMDGVSKTIKAGFENVTIDLIYSIPGMDITAWMSNLNTAFSLDIKHLSAYNLTVEPKTILSRMKEKGLVEEIGEEESISQFNVLIEKAETAGFVHYEISNFGKPGYFSVHNTNYWKQVVYLGLGPSAHSFNRYSRQWNVRDIKKYIKSVNDGKLSYEREELNNKTRFNEYIMTSLRTMWGIDLGYIEQVFEKEGYDYVVNLTKKFMDYGLMKQESNSMILTNQGKMISDNIISEFMMS